MRVSRPALVKLGGSILTDKDGDAGFRRAVAKRLLGEVAKSEVPAVLVHGAGSFGHPQVLQHGIGKRRATVEGVSETLAAVTELSGLMVHLAAQVGLRPMPVPLHLSCRSEGDDLVGFPLERLIGFLEEGYTPVLHGTVVRDDQWGWRVVGGDEIMEILAPELSPRLALFATAVDGVYEHDPMQEPDAPLVESITSDDDLEPILAGDADATGSMAGKLVRACAVAHECPVLILNGEVRGRVLDALKGKWVPATRIEMPAVEI